VRPPNGLKDFANLIKLEIAYDTDENGINMYYPASQIDLLEYSERELEKTPKISPRYFFDGMDSIIIYPKPTKPLMNGIRLHYNYYDVDLKETDDESKMNIPFYFIDLLFFYLDFCRKRYRSDITAAQLEYDLREKKLWEIVGVLNNRDVGPIEEEPIHLIGRFNG
jgi:hypothetical protein